MKAVIIMAAVMIVLLEIGLCMADDPDDDEKAWSGLPEEDEDE